MSRTLTSNDAANPAAAEKPNLLRRVLRLPRWKLHLLAESAYYLIVARAALLAVPFPRIGRYLGTLQPPSPLPPGTDPAIAMLCSRVGWAVNRMGDHMPVEMVCLPRALAAWQMLHRRGIVSRLHFGALREPDPARQELLQTHAWLTSHGVSVTGFPVAHACVELGYFARLVHGSEQPDEDKAAEL